MALLYLHPWKDKDLFSTLQIFKNNMTLNIYNKDTILQIIWF